MKIPTNKHEKDIQNVLVCKMTKTKSQGELQNDAGDAIPILPFTFLEKFLQLDLQNHNKVRAKLTVTLASWS